MATTIRLDAFTAKASPVPADIVYLGDSANAFQEVQSTIAEVIGAYPALSSIAGLTTAANEIIYTTAANTYATAPITTFGLSVLALTTATVIPAANVFAGWDANKNLSANNFLSGFQTIATAAASTTLTVASPYITQFTGSTTQTCVMPVVSTLALGQAYLIVNNSSGAITVNSSGGNLIQTMAANTSLLLYAGLITGTTAASWQVVNYATSDTSYPLSIALGGTGVSSVTVSPAASAWAGWDANKNLSANNMIQAFTTTASAGGTTTLTVASTAIQQITGTLTQTIVMPVVSTLVAGQTFVLINNSSGVVTVNSSGGNLIVTMAAGTTAFLTCVLITGTTAASWNSSYFFDNGAGVVSITGTANQVVASSATGAVVLSLPQSIATSSAVQFASLALGAYAVLPVTPWVAYTPTFTGFGTVSAVSVWSRRVGDNLEIRGQFTSGTATAVPAQITLGYNGTNANVTSSTSLLNSQNLCGSLVLSTVQASMPVMQVQSNAGYMTYGLQDGSRAGTTALNGNVGFSNGTQGLFYASVPIATWP